MLPTTLKAKVVEAIESLSTHFYPIAPRINNTGVDKQDLLDILDEINPWNSMDTAPKAPDCFILVYDEEGYVWIVSWKPQRTVAKSTASWVVQDSDYESDLSALIVKNPLGWLELPTAP